MCPFAVLTTSRELEGYRKIERSRMAERVRVKISSCLSV